MRCDGWGDPADDTIEHCPNEATGDDRLCDECRAQIQAESDADAMEGPTEVGT